MLSLSTISSLSLFFFFVVYLFLFLCIFQRFTMQAVRSAASHVPGSRNCWQRNWPRVFLPFSLATTALCFVAIIMGFIKALLKPHEYILDIYCLIFSLLGLSAEMRQFAWARRIVYFWMRYFYFLTFYKARAAFYIMFGCLLLNNSVLDIIAAVVTLVLGIMMLLVSLIVNLPVYEDPREQQEREEEYRSYYSGPTANHVGATATNVAVTTGNANTSKAAQNVEMAGFGPNNNNNVNDAQEDTPAQFSSSGATSAPQAAKAPPSAMPAQTNHNSNNNNNWNSSDDEPARREAPSTYNSTAPTARPYETNNSYDSGANMLASNGKSGPNMLAPSSPASRTTSVAPPLQEAGVTRGGGGGGGSNDTESAIRRQFAAAVASNLKDDDLR